MHKSWTVAAIDVHEDRTRTYAVALGFRDLLLTAETALRSANNLNRWAGTHVVTVNRRFVAVPLPVVQQ